MPSIKEYNSKIGSLKNTSKITKTMKMVSASKLRRSQDAQRQAKQFAAEVNNMIHRISDSVDAQMHPLLRARDEVKKVLLVVYSSDKGLCGGFNNNLIRFVERFLKDRAGDGIEYQLAFCGRRGALHFASRAKVHHQFNIVSADPTSHDASRIMEHLENAFLSGEFDEVRLVVNEFISPLSQVPKMHHLLPLAPADLGEDESPNLTDEDIIAEPAIDQLLQFLVPRLVTFRVFYALLENAAGEHGARMTAMDNATTNAMNLIDQYTLLRNRARQAAITTELIEIISGAEAL